MEKSTQFNIKYNTQAPVDVVIPFHGQYHFLGECLRSLITTTKGQLFTITVVDDCSPNKSFIDKVKKDKLPNIPIQYLHTEQHDGFGAALWKGFKHTQNQWVLFLHSDCHIEQMDWLMNMVICMQELKSDGVKLISAKVDNGGTGVYDSAVIGKNIYTKNVIAEEPLPLICALVHRSLFNHIGGFIKPYPYGWYEDEELFWRMKLSGYKQAVCGKAYVHHEGGATLKELMKNYKIREQMEANKDTYIADIREFSKQKKN